MEAIKLNPVFDDLNNPETIINHIEQLKEETKAGKNPFPVEVFPDLIQEVIRSTNETLRYPIDFTGSAILYAISVAVGNTHKAEIMNGWQENAVLYLSIVGRAGTSKSHPISWALRPIERKDKNEYQKYLEEREQYDLINSLSKKERLEQGFDEPKKPYWKQRLVTDFTPEALTDVHKHNSIGVGVYVDELASWFKNFNRYNKGSEEQFWLSVWSGKTIRINRKTSDPIFIQSPFIPVIGTIQPGVLNDLANNRTENGFLDRLLFVIPDTLKKEYWSENELKPYTEAQWEVVLSKLLDLPLLIDSKNNIQPEVLRFSQEAKKMIFDFQKKLTDRSNKANEETAGIYAKIEMYTIRLALLLELAFYACNESNKKEISVKAVQGAIKLVEYFQKTALKVHSILNANAFERLPIDKQTVYNALPDNFTTGEGVLIAQQNEMPERTFKRFLTEKELFNYNSRGEYEKKL